MKRLTAGEMNQQLSRVPATLRTIMVALRRTVLETAPEVDEAIRFGALCYFRPGQPFGAIGGNVCMIECRKGGVALSFIHGARLPDAEGLLRGSGKAKRHVPIRGLPDARSPALKALIRKAVTLVEGTEVK